MAKLVFNKPKRKKEQDKWCKSVRLPKKMMEKVRRLANEHYSGRGKISQFADEALNFYLDQDVIRDINWEAGDSDPWYRELKLEVEIGSAMRDLGQPTKYFFHPETHQKLVDLEVRLMQADPKTQNVKIALIRRALELFDPVNARIEKELIQSVEEMD